jgi:hypothetical protein
VRYRVEQTRNGKVTIIKPERKLGFGIAVRDAVRMSRTGYVWIQQHGWVLKCSVSISPLLQIMRNSNEDEEATVKYVYLLAVRMLGYAVSAAVVRFPVLRALTRDLRREIEVEVGGTVGGEKGKVKVELTLMFFWHARHDKPHVACRKHYLERVLPSRLAVLRGNFIKDKIR